MPCATFLPSALCLALGKVNLYRVPVVWHSAKLETLDICVFFGSVFRCIFIMRRKKDMFKKWPYFKIIVSSTYPDPRSWTCAGEKPREDLLVPGQTVAARRAAYAYAARGIAVLRPRT